MMMMMLKRFFGLNVPVVFFDTFSRLRKKKGLTACWGRATVTFKKAQTIFVRLLACAWLTTWQTTTITGNQYILKTKKRYHFFENKGIHAYIYT